MTFAEWLGRIVAALMRISIEKKAGRPPVVDPCPDPNPDPNPGEPKPMSTAGEVYQAVQRTKVRSAETADVVLETRRQLDVAESNHDHALEQSRIAEARAVSTFAATPYYMPETNTLIVVKDGVLTPVSPMLPDTEAPEVTVDVNGDGKPDVLDPPHAT